jgi:hypothetical protein
VADTGVKILVCHKQVKRAAVLHPDAQFLRRQETTGLSRASSGWIFIRVAPSRSGDLIGDRRDAICPCFAPASMPAQNTAR